MIFSKLPDECRLQVRTRVDNMALGGDRGYVTSTVMDDMRQALASKIVQAKMETTVQQYSTEFSVDVMVFSPDEFHRLVQEEAMALTRRMTPMKFTP